MQLSKVADIAQQTISLTLALTTVYLGGKVVYGYTKRQVARMNAAAETEVQGDDLLQVKQNVELVKED